MDKNPEISCAECIYCGSTENVFSFCKTQQTKEGEKKVCYCTCTSCAEHIENNLTPEVPCETCEICGKVTDVFAFCSYAPTEEGQSEKVCYCVCPDCVGKLQDKVFDYYDEALAKGYEPQKAEEKK